MRANSNFIIYQPRKPHFKTLFPIVKITGTRGHAKLSIES